MDKIINTGDKAPLPPPSHPFTYPSPPPIKSHPHTSRPPSPYRNPLRRDVSRLELLRETSGSHLMLRGGTDKHLQAVFQYVLLSQAGVLRTTDGAGAGAPLTPSQPKKQYAEQI